MASSLYKKFLISTGAILTGAAVASTGQAAVDASMKIGGPKTVTASGKNPQELNGGLVTFEVDARKIGNMDYLFSKRIAIVFEGEAHADRECPFISTDEREPKYKTITDRVFRVETPATKEEIAAVKKKGCLITESPPISSVLGGSAPKPSEP